MKYFLFLFLILNLISIIDGFNSLPDIRERSEWHITKRPAPVVKQAIYHEKYIDVVIGNPGHVTRLEVDFGCKDTVILFNVPEDTSRTWSVYPNTIIVYFGPVLLRLSFTVDPGKRDSKSYYPYEGYLCFGPHSDIWNYWSKLTLSPFRIVLGDYDRSLSRLGYDPFEFVFHKNVSKNTVHAVVNKKNYPFLFNLENEYTTMPRELYHNITTLDINIDNLCFNVDQDDIFIHLSNGFDRTMLRKSHQHDDHTISLGKNFARNFVIYLDAVTQTKYVMPSFHLFNNGNAEPLYSFLMLSIMTFLTVVWISIVTTKQFQRSQHELKELSPNTQPVFIDSGSAASIQGSIQEITSVSSTSKTVSVSESINVKPSTMYGIELYGYLSAIIILITDMNGFAGYRHFSYILSSSSSSLYILLTSMIVFNSLLGAVTTIASIGTHRFFNIRRLFFETVLFFTLWLISTHQHKTHSVMFLIMFFSAVYVNMRILHFAVNIIIGDFLMAFISSIYVIIALAFFIMYNVLPIMDFFFFRFDDQIERIILFLIITVGIPSLLLIGWYPLSVISNTAEDVNPDREVESSTKKEATTNVIAMMHGDDDDDDLHRYPHRRHRGLHQNSMNDDGYR